MTNIQRQVQTFGDISLGDGNVFTVNQILQVTASAIQTRPLNPTSPYRGLKRFEPDNKDLFFGRDQLIANLIEVVSQSNLILLLGASGSGKSSLVRAGLIPQIAEKLGSRFHDFTFTPDRNPFESLRISLVSNGYKQSEVESAFNDFSNPLTQGIFTLKEQDSQWLIFIDQFEEIFTLCQDLAVRKKFIDRLVAIARENDRSVKIVLAMRADFLDRFSPYPNLGRIAQQNIHLVTDMHPDELRLAIEQPAAHHGVVFEQGLVEEIIKDVQGQAGSLPLLQYTLDLLWQNEDISDRTLNVKTYRQLGGVRGALQRHIDRIYQHLQPEEQKAAKQIFLRLIDLTATQEFDIAGKVVSRRAYLSEFSDRSVQNMLNQLIDSNLLVSNRQEQSTVEIAHEILINSWSTLREWIEDSKETIAIRNRLSEDARRWQDAGTPQDELWSGSKLQRVEELRQKQEFDRLGGLSDLENQFIDVSIAERDRRLWEEQARRKRQLIAVLSASVIFAGLALLAGTQWHQAERQTTILKLREQANQASNLLGVNPVEGVVSAIALAGESLDSFGEQFAQIPQVRSSVRDAIAVPLERNALRGHQGPVWSAAFSPDGQIIVSGGADDTIRLWDQKGNPQGKLFKGHQLGIFSVAWSPDGQYIVSGGDDGTVRLWDKQGNPQGQPFLGHTHHVKSVAFSPDGKYIVSGSADGTIGLWDKQGNPQGQLIQGHRGEVWSVAFSPDGQYIASGGTDGTVRLWDKQGNPQGKPLQGHKERVFSVAFSQDGQTIASGSADNTIRLWDRKKGISIGQPFTGHEDFVRSVAFSPNGQYIVSSSDDKTIRLWDRKGNLQGKPLIGHEYYVYSVAFSPDGQTIVSSSEDSTVRLWNRPDNQINQAFQGHQDKVWSVAVSPDSQYIVSGSADNTIRLWDRSGNLIVQPLRGHQDRVLSVAVSFDGKYIVSGSADNTIGLWDKQGNAIARPFQGHEGAVYSVAFSPDGKYIVSGSADNTIRLWDKQGSAIAPPFKGHKSAVYSVAFSPDGLYIVSGSDDKTIVLWDRQGNAISQLFKGHTDEINSVAFSPDGLYIVSGSRDQTVRLWDRQGNSIGQPFLGHGSAVTSVAFSPDGQYIISGSRDRTVRLWDRQGNPIGQPLQGHESTVTSVAVSANGEYIVSGSWDNKVRIWQGGNFSTWLKQTCDKLREHSVLSGSQTEIVKVAAKTCRNYR